MFTIIYLGLNHTYFVEVYKVLHPATSNEPDSSEVLHLPHGRNHDDSFTKRDFQPLENVWKRHPSSPNTAPATQHDLKSTSRFDPRLPTF